MTGRDLQLVRHPVARAPPRAHHRSQSIRQALCMRRAIMLNIASTLARVDFPWPTLCSGWQNVLKLSRFLTIHTRVMQRLSTARPCRYRCLRPDLPCLPPRSRDGPVRYPGIHRRSERQAGRRAGHACGSALAIRAGIGPARLAGQTPRFVVAGRSVTAGNGESGSGRQSCPTMAGFSAGSAGRDMHSFLCSPVP